MKNTINKNLLTLRTKNHLTQVRMADLLEIERSRYSAYEEYRANPPIAILIKISETFNITIDRLVKTEIPTTFKIFPYLITPTA